MKVVTILGSPRKNGNTAKVLGWIEEQLAAGGHDVDRVNLCDHHVEDCNACRACQTEEDFSGCILEEDDGNSIMNRMVAADSIVFATPLYCWSFPAPLKALFDRGISLVHRAGPDSYRSVLDGKRTALLVTCGGPIEGNADLIGTIFDRICNFTRMKKTGEFIVPHCTEPGSIAGDVKEKAKNLASALVAQ